MILEAQRVSLRIQFCSEKVHIKGGGSNTAVHDKCVNTG